VRAISWRFKSSLGHQIKMRFAGFIFIDFAKFHRGEKILKQVQDDKLKNLSVQINSGDHRGVYQNPTNIYQNDRFFFVNDSVSEPKK
jgi:hypothetical protein